MPFLIVSNQQIETKTKSQTFVDVIFKNIF